MFFQILLANLRVVRVAAHRVKGREAGWKVLPGHDSGPFSLLEGQGGKQVASVVLCPVSGPLCPPSAPL